MYISEHDVAMGEQCSTNAHALRHKSALKYWPKSIVAFCAQHRFMSFWISNFKYCFFVKCQGTCKNWCLQTNIDIRLFLWSSTSFPVQTEPVSSLRIHRTCFIKTQEKLRSHFDTSLANSPFLVNTRYWDPRGWWRDCHLFRTVSKQATM